MTIIVRPQGIGNWSVKDTEKDVILVDQNGYILFNIKYINPENFIKPVQTQTAGIQEAFNYGYTVDPTLPQGQPGITVYLDSPGNYILNTSVHFPSTQNVWHNLVSASRGAVNITAPAGSTFPFFVVDSGFTEDLQFRGIVFLPQTSSQTILYSGSTSPQYSDYHIEECYFPNIGEIDINIAAIRQFTMNQCMGGVVLSINSILDYCHINNSLMNSNGNVLNGVSSSSLANIAITNSDIYNVASVGTSTTFLSVSNCNLSIDGLVVNQATNLLGVGANTNYIKLSRILTQTTASTFKLLSAQPTYLEIDDSLTQPYNPFADYPYYPNSTTNGTTAGTVNMVLQKNTPIYKKYMITFSGYENDTTTNQTISYPLSFSTGAVITANNTGLTISASTSGITITSPDSTVTHSGIVIIEGY